MSTAVLGPEITAPRAFRAAYAREVSQDYSDDIIDARRRSRACITAVLDPSLDQLTRDRIVDELAVEHQFNAILHLGATALSLLRMASPDPIGLLATFHRRFPDEVTVELVNGMLTAMQQDPSCTGPEFREAMYRAGEERGRDSLRDLSLVGAGAAWVVAEQQGVQPLEVVQVLAKTDEQLGPG